MSKINKKELLTPMENIVGKGFANTDDYLLDNYAYQYLGDLGSGGETKFVHRPICVVVPATTEEIIKIIKYWNKNGLQFKAQSTGWGAHNCVGNDDKVILLDLRRMNKILGIDEKNKSNTQSLVQIRSVIDSKIMYTQPILSRGDRRIGNLIFKAFSKGDTLNTWRKAVLELCIPYDQYLSEKSLTYHFPWDFIHHGISDDYLKNEWKLALKGKRSPICMQGCIRCSLCENKKSEVENKRCLIKVMNY